MEYEVSWSRSQKKFRWVGEDGVEVWCSEAEGLCEMVGTDNETGRLHVAVDGLEVEGEFVRAVQEVQEVQLPLGAVELEGAGYWRLCYRRAQQDWRVRDENGSGKVTFVNTYKGQVGLDWHDHAAHLFHKGKMFLFEGDAYLVPEVVCGN